jgi:hypothetical protein
MSATVRAVFTAVLGIGLVLAGAPEAAAQAAADETVRVGAPVRGAPGVSLREVLADPESHAGREVVVDGMVTRACTSMGCWMQLAPDAESDGVRVTFKDYAFFVPLNAAGMRARAQGEFVVRRLGRRELEQRGEDAAPLRRARDGSAFELSFVAAGVELRP